MRVDEIRDVSRLAALGLRGLTSRIAETHAGIAARAFGAVGPAGRPVQLVHDAVAGFTYATVRTALGLAARAAGEAAALRATGGRELDATDRMRTALGILNGTHGDLIERAAPSLSVPMSVRVAGRLVPPEPGALAAAFPEATGRLAVFVHGLTETERAWCYRAARFHGDPDVSFGTQLRRDLGFTPVLLRYNTGRHVSDNGRSLDELLSALVAGWPVEARDVVLVGHSMGGLVARSALHQAGGGTAAARAWTRLVRDTITLGSPHLGAPLERAAHRLTGVLAALPETRPLSRVLAGRSAGIKDLRRGTLVEGDWLGRDLDAPAHGAHTHVPLADGARHFVVLATVPRDPEGPVAQLVGDLLVSPRSACGDTGGEDRLAFPAARVHRLGGLTHLDLLNHPRVYRQLHAWLADR